MTTYKQSPDGNVSSDVSITYEAQTSEKGQDVRELQSALEDDAGQKSTHAHAVTFSTVDDVRFYKPIESYEGFHRWDPYFEWEDKEEKKLVRKVRMSTGAVQVGG